MTRGSASSFAPGDGEHQGEEVLGDLGIRKVHIVLLEILQIDNSVDMHVLHNGYGSNYFVFTVDPGEGVTKNSVNCDNQGDAFR